MDMIKEPHEVTVEMYRITDHIFEDDNHIMQPFEGHIQVTGTTKAETHKQFFPAGSVYISTDQPLGDLAMMLLEPTSKDSYFSWGFFTPFFNAPNILKHT